MSKKIVIAGGTGLIGSSLKKVLMSNGHEVFILTRNPSYHDKNGYIIWNPYDAQKGDIDLTGIDVVINLAGASIIAKKWTSTYRTELIQSRTLPNDSLARSMKMMSHPPVYISASAIGIYGPDIKSSVNESRGENFVQTICKAWEEAASNAALQAGRHCLLRIGIVLADSGGAFKKINDGFKFGLGAYFAPGDQIYSWIHIDDVCNLINFIIENDNISGVIDAVAPHPVTARKLARVIGKARFNNFLLFPLPKLFAKLLLGDRQQLLTDSIKVLPGTALENGYTFTYNEIESAVENLLR